MAPFKANPTSHTVSFQLKFPRRLHSALREAAIADHRSMQQYIVAKVEVAIAETLRDTPESKGFIPEGLRPEGLR